MESSFWLNQAFKFSIFYLIAYFSGMLVLKKGLRVNYTRKINHFVLFFFPHFLGKVLPFRQTTQTILIGSFLSVMSLLIYLKPVRERISAIHRCSVIHSHLDYLN